MTKPVALAATYSDLKFIKTRGVVQIVLEMPLADFHNKDAYDFLGGLPNPASEKWFAIAAIAAESASRQEQSKRTWRDMSPQQQAGMRCEEAAFQTFLKEEKPDDWHESSWDAAECVRLICGVQSRSELETNHGARVIWHQLDSEYQAWLQVAA